MTVAVRLADLDQDRGAVMETLAQFLNPLCDDRWFDWLYRENPHGQARVWIAESRDKREVVGVASAFPRRMYVDGSAKRGCVLGDFCIDSRYRTLGPALQLQRACLAEIDAGTLAVCYDFPSRSMTAVYTRLGVELQERMVRMAKPLRTARQIGERVKLRPLARGLSAAADRWLALRDRSMKKSSECAIGVHEDVCGEEFTALAERLGARYGVCVQRTAEYLNWRYRAHPHRRYEILAARRNGVLVGYAVFTRTEEDATIVDLMAEGDRELIGDLVSQVVARMKEQRVATVSAPLLASHPWVRLFASLGFYPRESSPVVALTTLRPVKSVAGKDQGWFLMEGDRES